MALFKVVVEAYVASRELDQASLSRLVWWIDVLGEKELTAISEADIDAAMVKLAERGRLRAGRGMTTKAIGKPLAGSTINRYLTQAGSIYKHAKRLKLVPRAFVAPTRGIERTLERPDPERYLRPEEVERLLAVARVMDRRWGKMAGGRRARGCNPRPQAETRRAPGVDVELLEQRRGNRPHRRAQDRQG